MWFSSVCVTTVDLLPQHNVTLPRWLESSVSPQWAFRARTMSPDVLHRCAARNVRGALCAPVFLATREVALAGGALDLFGGRGLLRLLLGLDYGAVARPGTAVLVVCGGMCLWGLSLLLLLLHHLLQGLTRVPHRHYCRACANG